VRVVIDTNVLVAALRSRHGASFQLLQRLGSGPFQPVVSSPLCLEYEDVLHRPGLVPGYAREDIEDFLDYVLAESIECQVHFLWRPFLPDAKDDLVLEAAVAGGASFIITFNLKDFKGIGALGIQAVTPGNFFTNIIPL